MCGIIGYIGPKNSLSVVIDGLKRLEYRGYDSAGVAFIEEGSVRTVRSAGKISRLEGILGEREPGEKFSGAVIGHTRWATHGGPSEKNAHPHKSGRIVLVHNGIIENYQSLRKKLKADGFEFASETDTEVICHLINLHSRNLPFEEAVRVAVSELKGAYALAIMHAAEPWKIIGVKKDSPLVLGVGEGEFFISSDASAFIAHTNKALFLEDGEMAVVTPEGFNILSIASGESSSKNLCVLPFSQGMAEKGGHKHFMLKEI
ncbi:MAG: class II glutamine amidotransferase, partial [Nitrospiraceae bacterium]|nr:class II glutamine amidotransferase [Nitrospiraceae bacterium]